MVMMEWSMLLVPQSKRSCTHRHHSPHLTQQMRRMTTMMKRVVVETAKVMVMVDRRQTRRRGLMVENNRCCCCSLPTVGVCCRRHWRMWAQQHHQRWRNGDCCPLFGCDCCGCGCLRECRLHGMLISYNRLFRSCCGGYLMAGYGRDNGSLLFFSRDHQLGEKMFRRTRETVCAISHVYSGNKTGKR